MYAPRPVPYNQLAVQNGLLAAQLFVHHLIEHSIVAFAAVVVRIAAEVLDGLPIPVKLHALPARHDNATHLVPNNLTPL